jgi:hypothetical protein
MFGSATTLTDTFVAQTQVVITHNLGYAPKVVVYDNSGNELYPEITHTLPDLNVTTLDFTPAQTGTWQIDTSVEGGLLDSFLSALPTWSAQSLGSIPTAPTVVADAATIIGQIPTMSAPSLTAISTTRIYNALNQASDVIGKSNLDGATDAITADALAHMSTHDAEVIAAIAQAAGAQVQSARDEIQIEATKLSKEVAELEGEVGKFNGEVQAWLGRIRAYEAEDNPEIEIWKSQVERYVSSYQADIQNETNRFRGAVELATAYLRAIEQKINVVRTYFSAGESLTYEFRSLHEEYLRVVMSFCGVTRERQDNRS